MFELDIFNTIPDDPVSYFEDVKIDERLFVEDKEESIGSKIKTGIKKGAKAVQVAIATVIDWIAKWVNKIIKWIKNLFVKKKTKSIEDVLVDLGVVEKKDIESGVVKIPSSDDSTVTPMDITKLMESVKQIKVSFRETNNEVVFTFRDSARNLFNSSKKSLIPGQSEGLSGLSKFFAALFKLGEGRILMAWMFITNYKDCTRKFIDFCQTLFTSNPSDPNVLRNLKSKQNQLLQFLSLFKEYKVEDASRFNIALRALEECQEDINKLGNCISSAVNVEAYNAPVVSDYLQIIQSIISCIQYGMNDMTKCLEGAVALPPQYCNTIRTTEILAEFVSRLIDHGIPSKYIGANIYYACHGDLKGEGSPLNPIWGQSRVVLFPNKDKDIVYKVSINGIGKMSNVMEAKIWTSVHEDPEDSKYFCPVKGLAKNKCLLAMSRADTDSKGFLRKTVEALDITSKIQEICNRHKIPDVSVDIHQANIGWFGKHICLIDYGNAKYNQAA